MKEYAYEFADLWYSVPTPLEKDGGMRLLRIGRNVAKPNYAVGPKEIGWYGLHFIEEGGVLLESGGREWELRKGDWFCLFPGPVYTYRLLPGETGLRMVWLSMDGPQMPALLDMCGMREQRPTAAIADMPACWRCLDQLVRLYAGGNDSFLRVQQLLYGLFEALSAAGNEAEHGGSETDGGWFAQALDYFQLHFTEPLRIEEAARRAGVHRSYFSSEFSRRMGVSPQQYMHRLRMEKGKQLLAQSERSMTEIAYSLGFADLYAFSRAFKRHAGCSPLQFRRRVRVPVQEAEA
ncbi:MAG: helix-turn-helix transcriptional regulator [Paenibacillaceae bacterium]|nr:helix-turn-helix transcriptional regulator [Paenibacillaceae bacterium]